MTNQPDICAGWKPIYPTKKDVQYGSDGLIHQILAHNRFGAENCEWKPVK